MENQKELTDDEKQKLMDTFGVYYPTKEEEEELTLKLKEDAKKPLTEQNYLSSSLGTVEMDEHFFEENLRDSLIHSRADIFIKLQKRTCEILGSETKDFNPISHLRNVLVRIHEYIKNIEYKSELQKLLYTNTSRAIEDRIDVLIQHYHTLAESSISDASTLTKENNTNIIYILPDARQGLIEELLQYIDPSQSESLKALINDSIEPEQQIICNCKQVELGRIFYQYNDEIKEYKTKIAQWICQHFVRSESGEIKNLTESTLLNHLKGKGFAQY